MGGVGIGIGNGNGYGLVGTRMECGVENVLRFEVTILLSVMVTVWGRSHTTSSRCCCYRGRYRSRSHCV